MPINLTVLFTAQEGREAELQSVLETLTDASFKEEACLQYDLHRDTANPALFILHEIWTDEDGLALHGTMPHIQHFRELSPSLVKDRQIYRTKRLK